MFIPLYRSPLVSSAPALFEPTNALTTSELLSDKSCHSHVEALESSDDLMILDFQPLYLSSSSCPSFPSPPGLPRPYSSAQGLTDQLKIECLTSCLAVRLQPLSSSLLKRASRESSSVSPGPTVSPPSSRVTSKQHLQMVPKERPAGPGTQRKAGVSGLSAGRWSRQVTCNPRHKSARNKSDDASLSYLLPIGGAEASTMVTISPSASFALV